MLVFEINRDLMGMLTSLSPICTSPDCKAYLVGGFVRDWLMGRDTTDLDIAVKGDSLAIAQEAAELVDGRYVVLDEDNKVGRVVVAGESQPWHIDVTSYDGDIGRDLLRRDFTVNAMAMDMEAFVQGDIRLFDPTGGEEDLKKGLLRQISDRVFADDPSRLMRAVRLARELNLDIEPDTEETIRLNKHLVTCVPSEKTREEFLKVMALPYACNSLRHLNDLGLLSLIIPEMEAMKGVKQPGEHYWDVFDHSIESVAAIEFLLRESDWVYGSEGMRAFAPWSEEIENHFRGEIGAGVTRGTLIKIGAMLHDISKPATRTVDENGKIRFYGHTKEGAASAVAILERLRFSGKEIRYIEMLVYHHLHPAQMANEGLPTHRAIYRYFRDTEGAGIDVIFLALADYLAVGGPRVDIDEWHMHIDYIQYIMNVHNKQESEIMPLKLITGDDLINEFNLVPGKNIGRLLSMVREAQAAGEIHTREEALKYIRNDLGRGACCAA
ncbi:MAG: CCA tRNA nucleotidyltransferase [Dehalococcoidia bacterium]|nr:CCA tRNA nucleotidyltransferase [Dehalococcoidia bacterium]